MCYSSLSDLPVCTMPSCLLEDRAIVRYSFSLRYIVALLPPKGKKKSYSCWKGREKGLQVPSTIVVLMSKSSGEDCCSDEIKAAAFPSTVYLH